MLRLLILIWTLIFSFPSANNLCAQFNGYSNSTYEKSLHYVRLDFVDLSILKKEAESRALGSSEQELNRLLTRNFRHIFLNQLNRSQFIVAPKPQTVANHIVNIFHLNKDLENLIEEGNRIQQGQQSNVQMRQIIGQVKKTAEDLNKSFHSFFVETHRSTYSMVLPSRGDNVELFRFYLRQSKQINRELTQSLDRYFFNLSPIAVSLDDYAAFSISVLSKSLSRLSDGYSRIFTQKH